MVGFTPATHTFRELEDGTIEVRRPGRKYDGALLPWLAPEDGPTSIPLLRRRLRDMTTRQVSSRTDLLWDSLPAGGSKGGGEGEGKSIGGGPITTDVDGLVRADPGFSLEKRHQVETLVQCPLDRRAMAKSHFEHCSLCNPRKGMLGGGEGVCVGESEGAFVRRVFNCFHPGCYAQHLYRGLAYGYLPATKGPVEEFDFQNYKSVEKPENPEALRKAWRKQRDMKGVFGPGDSAYVSPLTLASRFPEEWKAKLAGTVPKRRVCFDASRGLNWLLLKHKFRYTDFPFILRHLREGCFMAMVDLRSFYLQLPMAPEFTKYLSLRDPFTGELLRYLRLPFGLSTAPAWASAVTAEIRRVMLARGVRAVFVYIDDYCCYADTYEECLGALKIVLAVLREFGVAVAHEKIVMPTQRTDILGVGVDSKEMKLRVRESHVEYTSTMIRKILRQGRLSKKVLKSLCGMFTWISPMVRGSRPYVRSMWDMQRNLRRAQGRIKLTAAARADLKWWAGVLEDLEDARFEVSWADQSQRRLVVLASDASGDHGWGVWVGESLYSGEWTEEQMLWSVPRKELAPPVRAVEELADGWGGALVVLATDSITNAYAINAGSSTTEAGTAWLKRLSKVERAMGIDVVALWLPRELNVVPDALSKGLIRGLNIII